MSSINSSDLEILKDVPSVSDIERITDAYTSQTHDLKIEVQFIIAYLQYVLPVYESLRSSLKVKIRRIFYSMIAISNLCSQFRLSKNDVYLVFMKDLLYDPSLLVSVIESTNGDRLELNQINSMFFGSKIYNLFQGKLELDLYLRLLVKQLVEACRLQKNTSAYFISFLSLHPMDSKIVLFDEFLTNMNFQWLVCSVKQMTTLQKKQLISKHLLAYLSTQTHINNAYTSAKILHQLDITDIEDSVVDSVSKIDNYELQQSVSLVVKDHKSQVVRLLKLWGLEQYIKDISADVQELLTRELLLLLSHLTPSSRVDISKSRDFLDAITTRLETNDNNKRNQAMIIAKSITNNEINFEVENEIVVQKLDVINLDSTIDFNHFGMSGDLKNLSLSSKKETVIVDSDDESDDEGDEDEEPMPVFLKDLIVKFTKGSPKSIANLLTHTNKLVRQKATFKLEIEFYSEELISVLVGLINKYDEPGFEELKINAIVSVIVVNPIIITKVIELLFSGDYSIHQRISILTSISLSARELRGIDDTFIDKPKSDFPTQQLPKRKLVQEIEQKKIEEINDIAVLDQHIGNGTIVRKSRKLTSSKPDQKPNNFAKIAPRFFYPLANAWIEGNMITGNFSELFKKHYLQTLDLIMHAAYPCYGFEDMAELHAQIKDTSQNIFINV